MLALLAAGCISPISPAVDTTVGSHTATIEVTDESESWFDALPDASHLIVGDEIIADPVALGLNGVMQAYAIRFLENQTVAEAGWSAISDAAFYEGAPAPCTILIRAAPTGPAAFGPEGAVPSASGVIWGKTTQVATNMQAEASVHVDGQEFFSETAGWIPESTLVTRAGSNEYGKEIAVKAGSFGVLLVGADGLEGLQADPSQMSYAKMRPTGTFDVALASERPIWCGTGLEPETSAQLALTEANTGGVQEWTTHNGTSLWLAVAEGTGTGRVTIDGSTEELSWGPAGQRLAHHTSPEGSQVRLEVDRMAGNSVVWMVRDDQDWNPSEWFTS